MKDDRKIRDNQLKKNYDDRMKDKGFVKACLWMHPDDFPAIQRKAEISRNKHSK